MQTVLKVDPDELRAAASRWQMIGSDLSAGGAPPVSLGTSWPSAAATAGFELVGEVDDGRLRNQPAAPPPPRGTPAGHGRRDRSTPRSTRGGWSSPMGANAANSRTTRPWR